MRFSAEAIHLSEALARIASKSKKISGSGLRSLALLLFGVVAALYGVGCAGRAGQNGGGTNGGHLVTLNWSPATALVTGYNVYRAEQPEGPFARLKTVAAPAHQFADIAVQPGGTYYYVVTSVAADGMESEDSIQVTARIP